MFPLIANEIDPAFACSVQRGIVDCERMKCVAHMKD